MKPNKHLNIAHTMGYIKHRSQIYKEPLKTGLQGVAMYLLDEIESINERRASKGILDEYELMKNFFNEIKNYYK